MKRRQKERKWEHMERQWKLGVDVHPEENILDGMTFNSFILALSQRPDIDEKAVQAVKENLLEIILEDMEFLISNNMAEIIRRAKKGECK
ncbi:MAG: hypothetical protein R3Y55_03800 [Rikenellaceae bacterium]